jgi:transposase
MLLETILRRFESHKGFVFGNARWREKDTEIEIPVRPRKGSRAICSYCGRMLPTYDHLEKLEFRFLPLWIFAVTFTYVMRRVQCPEHGVVVEKVPWAHGKSHLTVRFSLFLAHWAKRLSWSEVAGVFEVSWQQVYRAVERVVEYGLTNRRLRGVTAIGIDEVQYGHGHQYMTLVYDIGNETRRLLYVGRDRTVKSLLRFFHEEASPRLLN